MLCLVKLCIATGLIALFFVLPTHQNVLPGVEIETTTNLSIRTVPVELFYELSTSAEGVDEREEDLIDGIIFRIAYGQPKSIEKALLRYRKLSSPSKYIKRIVSEIFQENHQNGDNIIQFITMLSDTELKYFAIWTLHEEMLLADEYKIAGQAINLLQSLQNSSSFESFSEFDQRNAKVLLKSLEKMDRNVKVHVESQKLLELQNMLILLLPDVDKNFKEILKIAIMIKDMEINIPDENKGHFNFLKAQIPKTITDLVWQETVCIKKPGTGYMYADEFGNYLSYRDTNVMVSIFTSGRTPSKGHQWVFEIDDDKETFYIRNSHLKQYLYGVDELLNSDNCCNKLYFESTRTNSSDLKWEIQSVNDKGKELTIRNSMYNRYLRSTGAFASGHKQPVYLHDEINTFIIEKC